jgi:hypothetical protein
MLSKIIRRNAAMRTGKRSMSVWSELEAAPADPILGLNDQFKKDTNPKKVLLGMGTYRDDKNKPYIL